MREGAVQQSPLLVHAVVKGVVRAMASQSKRGQAVELEFEPAGTLQLRPSRAHGMVHKFAFNPRLAGPQRTARSRPATAAANKPANASANASVNASVAEQLREIHSR